jgi:hypothetical protein
MNLKKTASTQRREVRKESLRLNEKTKFTNPVNIVSEYFPLRSFAYFASLRSIAVSRMNEVDVRLLFERPLPRQLPDYDRIGRARELEHFLRRQVIQRMRRDDERQVLELEIPCGQPSVRQERP